MDGRAARSKGRATSLLKRGSDPFNRKSTSDGMLITYSRIGGKTQLGKDVRAMGETIGQPKDRK